MWLLNASRCFQASATWWKSPNENGLLVISAWSHLVGARTSQTIGATKKMANVRRIASRTPRPKHAGRHQSSVLNSPLRVTINTAPTRPIMSRSTAMAAAPLKSAYRKANW